MSACLPACLLACLLTHSGLASRPAFFLPSLQGRWPLFDELQALDPEVYRSLMQLKRYEGAVQDLCLDFTGGLGVPAGRAGGRGWEYAGWHGRPHANVPSAAANNS